MNAWPAGVIKLRRISLRSALAGLFILSLAVAAPAQQPGPDRLSDHPGRPAAQGDKAKAFYACAARLTGLPRDVVVRCGLVGDTLPGDLAVEQVEEWKWRARSAGQSSIERELLALNSDLDVLVAHGRSDLVTPIP